MPRGDARSAGGASRWHIAVELSAGAGPGDLRYLRLLIVPYGFTVDADIHVPPAWLGILAWVPLRVGAFLWRYRSHAWAPWLLAALILLIPSSSVFPRRICRRIAYLPSHARIRSGCGLAADARADRGAGSSGSGALTGVSIGGPRCG